MNVLRYEAVSQLVHYTPVHIRRLISAGKFPKPIRLGANRVVFDESEIENWLKEKADERTTL